MNAAARVASDTKKYDRGLTHLLHSELHWLDVADSHIQDWVDGVYKNRAPCRTAKETFKNCSLYTS